MSNIVMCKVLLPLKEVQRWSKLKLKKITDEKILDFKVFKGKSGSSGVSTVAN